MKLIMLLYMVIVGFASKVELESLRQLDLHYRNNMKNSDTLSTPFQRITRLFHKHGKSRRHVSINKNIVNANGEDRSSQAHLVIESDSFGTIKIHSVDSPIYYLCIGNDYKPTGIPKESLDNGGMDVRNCIFKESFFDRYVQFKSVKFFSEKDNTGCLAFNKHGIGRKINRSRCGHKSSMFMERKSRIIVDLYKNGTMKNKLISLLRSNKVKQT